MPGRPSGFWLCGLGAKSAQGANPLSRLPGYVFPLAGAVCLFFLGVRHDWLGPQLTQEALGLSLDKWQIGPLRVLNLFAFACMVYWSRKYLTRVVLVEPFLTLGKASLEVFCAHLFFVFVGLALLYGEVTELHGPYAIMLLAITFTGLILVAVREVRRKRKAKLSPPPEATTGVVSSGLRLEPSGGEPRRGLEFEGRFCGEVKKHPAICAGNMKEDWVRNNPTQAKRRLEWATQTFVGGERVCFSVNLP